jgi:hypothetical protein
VTTDHGHEIGDPAQVIGDLGQVIGDLGQVIGDLGRKIGHFARARRELCEMKAALAFLALPSCDFCGRDVRTPPTRHRPEQPMRGRTGPKQEDRVVTDAAVSAGRRDIFVVSTPPDLTKAPSGAAYWLMALLRSLQIF